MELPEALSWRKPVQRIEPASTVECKGQREGEKEGAQRSNSDRIRGAWWPAMPEADSIPVLFSPINKIPLVPLSVWEDFKFLTEISEPS